MCVAGCINSSSARNRTDAHIRRWYADSPAQTDDGVIEVVDNGDSRSLHFGTYPRQSSMRLSDPAHLALSYTVDDGLPAAQSHPTAGAGNWSRWWLAGQILLQHFPQCQIDVVEYRRDVIEVAAHYFNVPLTDPRLNIVQAMAICMSVNCSTKQI